MTILYAVRKKADKADYEARVTREEAELAVKLFMEVYKQLEGYLEGVRGGRDWKPNTSIPEQRL
jgi:hypothetical protein